MTEVSSEDWNRLVQNSDPFVSHAFLSALEQSGSVSEETGWQPKHLLLFEQKKLIAAMPLYLKEHSWGEYVFDQQWSAAYARSGMAYYPKWVNSVPFTPCRGQRILLESGIDPAAIVKIFLDYIKQLSRRDNISSLHCLFPEAKQIHDLQAHMLIREGIQFHWFNRGYRDFADYLHAFTARHRKKINKERRKIAEQGIQLQRLTGEEITDFHWQEFYRFYQMTYLKRGQYAHLNNDFFQRVAQTMPDDLLMVLARKNGRYVGVALSFIGDSTLFGRYWGCYEEYSGLHFEACYYQGLEFCLEQGLTHFDSGAQGEHKISRGFEPIRTFSAHWLANDRFSELIGEFIGHEKIWIDDYYQECVEQLPFNSDVTLTVKH